MRAVWFFLSLLFLAGCAQIPTPVDGLPAAGDLVITRHPADQVVPRFGAATLAVQVTGTGPLTYQWFRDGKPAPLGNTDAITLPRFTEKEAGVYAVRITNPAGSITSLGARLTLADAPPPPVALPSGLAPVTEEIFKPGEPLRLAAVTGGAPPFTYQWYKDGDPIAGATEESFVRPQAQPGDAGVYVCVVRNKFGFATSQPIKAVVK